MWQGGEGWGGGRGGRWRRAGMTEPLPMAPYKVLGAGKRLITAISHFGIPPFLVIL